jgi:hypothetical protein
MITPSWDEIHATCNCFTLIASWQVFCVGFRKFNDFPKGGPVQHSSERPVCFFLRSLGLFVQEELG